MSTMGIDLQVPFTLTFRVRAPTKTWNSLPWLTLAASRLHLLCAEIYKYIFNHVLNQTLFSLDSAHTEILL